MKTRIGLIILVVFFANISCKHKSSSDANAVEAVAVTVATVDEREYAPVLNFSGTVEANREANLATTLPGRVEKIYFKEGDYIPQGKIIAELSDEMLIQAMVEYETLKKDFERIRRLKEKGSVRVIDYDHIKAKYEASEAKVRLMRKNTTITAPFSGVLTDIMIEEGENYALMPSVSPDFKLKSGILTLMQLNPLKVKIEVNEKNLRFVSKGTLAKMRFDAIPDREFTGKVRMMKPTLNLSTRTTTVEIELENSKQEIKPGMYANVELVLDKVTGLFVPLNAIYRQSGTGDDYLFVVDAEHKVKRVLINRIQTIGDEVVVSGVSKGLQIVIDGKNKLSEGSVVKVSNRK